MRKQKKCQIREFSLVELLVVIALMAVLGSLLTPSLRNVMVSSQKTSCMMNLKGVYAGQIMFSDDHNDLMWSARGYGYTTYGKNDFQVNGYAEGVDGFDNTANRSWEKQGIKNGQVPFGRQFNHGEGYLEPYIGEKGSKVHFCPSYEKPDESEYSNHLNMLKRGDYTSFRGRMVMGSFQNSGDQVQAMGGAYRLSDYRVSTAWGYNGVSGDFVDRKPHISFDQYLLEESWNGQAVVKRSFSYLPLVMDYIPQMRPGLGEGFNAGNGAAFYNQKSLIHDGIAFPLVYTDGHGTGDFMFPYLSLNLAGGDNFEFALIKALVDDLRQSDRH